MAVGDPNPKSPTGNPNPPGTPGNPNPPVPCVTASELLEVRARCQPTADGTGNVILTEAALNWFKAHLMKRPAHEREHPGDEGPKE